MRDTVKEIAGSVERVDDPARLGRIAFDLSGFLQQETPVGARQQQFVADSGAPIVTSSGSRAASLAVVQQPPSEATVALAIDEEGVRGTVACTRGDGGWVPGAAALAEH